MPCELFLNELSVPQGNLGIEAACAHLRAVVGTVRAIRAIDSSVCLNTETPINAICIGEGNAVAVLRNNGRCVEEAQFLKLLKDRSPFERIAEELGGDGHLTSEYRLTPDSPVSPGIVARALGLSHSFAGIAVSFGSHECWNESEIPLDKTYLDDEGEIQSLRVLARNACLAAHVPAHAQHLQDAVRGEVIDGRDAWARRADIFPHLRFIPRVQAQIESLQGGDRVLRAAVARLLDIEGAVAAWAATNAPAPEWTCFVRPESATRIQKGLVNFSNDEGAQETFSDHADFGPAEGRVHFILKTTPDRHALVGHVGRKLGIG